MASQLKVDTITGVTTAGSVAVTGEGNSTTTNLQQGLAKLWHQTNASSGTPATQDSLNRSGLTDNGTGDYTVSFTNNMNNNEYSFQQSCQSESGVSVASYNLANTLTSSFRQYSFTQHTSPAATDTGMVTLSIFGDLA